MKMAEDQLLVVGIKNRNHSAFEAFFHRYYNELLAFSEGIVSDIELANDIVQTVFVRIWEIANTLEADTPLRPYVYRAVKNRSLNHLRDTSVYHKHSFLYWQDLDSSETANEDGMKSEMVNEIHNSLDHLPSRMRKVLTMKYLEERRHRDIAETLCISENTVKTQLLRGKSKLRELLKDTQCVQ